MQSSSIPSLFFGLFFAHGKHFSSCILNLCSECCVCNKVDFTIMKKIILVLFLHVYTTSCCTYLDSEQRHSCGTPIEVSVEGTEEWNNLIVYNLKKPFSLKKDSFKKTPNLRTLSIGTCNRIEAGAFNGLDKLDRLVIFDSDLEEIPVGVLDNLPIRSLQIFKKMRSIYPGFFKNLPDLREADIRKNTFEKIQVGIFNNTLIYKLYLDFNKISQIEDGAFYDMEAMIYLSLSANNLASFDGSKLLGSNSLEVLWLNINQLTKVTKSMFSNLQDLNKLHLEINQIESIEDGSFDNLLQLDFLDLSNNKLKEIQPKIFPEQGLKLMTYLFVHNNKLTFINNALFIKTPNLQYISYGGNPFQCPCRDDTKSWVDSHNITTICDDVYFAGERPVCVFSEIERKKCIYDVDLTESLSETYEEALKEYPKLELKCDTTKGVSNATLSSGV